jgi:hypothetical protein
MRGSCGGLQTKDVAKEGIEPPTLSGVSENCSYRVAMSIKSLRNCKSDVKKDVTFPRKKFDSLP